MDEFAQIRELFQDAGLRSRLDEARSPEEAVGVLVLAGSAGSVDFSAEAVSRIAEVFAGPKVAGPGRDDLSQVAGARRMAETHVHMSCCTDCPSSAALCC